MADFLSRLAARTLGVAPTAQPSIAPIFAQERMQAEHDSLESWVESEPPGEWESQQNGRPALSRQVPPSPPIVAKDSPSPASPQQPSADPYGSADVIDANVRNVDVTVQTTHPRYADLTTPSLEQVASVLSLPVTGSNDLVPAPAAAHVIAEESGKAVPLEQSQLMHSTEHVSPRNQLSVTRSSPIIYTDEAMPLANPLVPLQTMPGDRQGGAIKASNRQRRRYAALANDRHTINALQEIQVEQDSARPLVPVTPSMQESNVGAARSAHQFIEPSRADAFDVQPSAALSPRSITPGGAHAQPAINNQQVIEAQLIEQPAPAPTIQVTIGRIEVRATPPPAPSQSQQRSTPSIMSLDQYLQQRSKGGDR
jgi:hypothetical protein